MLEVHPPKPMKRKSLDVKQIKWQAINPSFNKLERKRSFDRRVGGESRDGMVTLLGLSGCEWSYIHINLELFFRLNIGSGKHFFSTKLCAYDF